MNDLGYRWLSVAGAPLYWHGTVLWIPIAVIFNLSNSPNLVLLFIAGGLITALVISSILLHEAAHVIAARRFGIHCDAIILHGVGGVALIDADGGDRRQRIIVSIAGPLANIVLAAACLGAMWLLTAAHSAADMFGPDRSHLTSPGFAFMRLSFGERVAQRVLTTVAWINMAFGLVNLLPCFPLDGGRILHTALHGRIGLRRLNYVLGGLGLLSGYLVIGAGSLYGLGLALVGIAMMASSIYVLWTGRSFD